MNESKGKMKGYVYILEVKDIDLPVCKIGKTSRNPHDRCSEINSSSTGDFIWEVAYQVAVDDCTKFESLAHKKLEPLRQKNREFFNISAGIAYKALLSILENQSDIKLAAIEKPNNSTEGLIKERKRKSHRSTIDRKIDPLYSEALHLFTSLLGVKGRPFGQLNKPIFGMSDGNKGVQWNLRIYTDDSEIKLGVNLEGMKYLNWPISSFIQSELENPSIIKLKKILENPEQIFIRFARDAWQVQSRPFIVEELLGGKEISISEMDSELWALILREALGCLDEKKMYRGRGRQTVTLVNKPKKGQQVRTMQVSPHLTIWTPIELSGDVETNLKNGIELLKPVHEWVTRVSQ